MHNRAVLDSALLRCNAERERTLGDPECINARKAVARIAAIEEEEKKARLEAESERKRDQLRRQRVARDRILAERKERAQAEAAVREMEAFTGTEDLPPAVTAETTTDGVASLPVDSTAQLPAGMSVATDQQTDTGDNTPLASSPNQVAPVTIQPAPNQPVQAAPGNTVTAVPPVSAAPVQQAPVSNDPVSAGSQSMQAQPAQPPSKSDDEIAAEIARLEAELRNRRESEILRLEEELRLRKQQGEATAGQSATEGDNPTQ